MELIQTSEASRLYHSCWVVASFYSKLFVDYSGFIALFQALSWMFTKEWREMISLILAGF